MTWSGQDSTGDQEELIEAEETYKFRLQEYLGGGLGSGEPSSLYLL